MTCKGLCEFCQNSQIHTKKRINQNSKKILKDLHGSPCTSRSYFLLLLPATFEATQVNLAVSVTWDRRMVNSRPSFEIMIRSARSVFPRGWPFLNHVITGGGSAKTGHSSVTVLFSITVGLLGLPLSPSPSGNFGGTVGNEESFF